MKTLLKRGVTLLELLVVLVIVSILSTIAVGVYSNHITRARFAKARAEIRMLETAVTSYQIDNGALPLSGSGNTLSAVPAFTTAGTGYLQVALRNSYSGNFRTASPRWLGPYVDWDYNRMGQVLANGTVVAANSDPFNSGATGTINQAEISFLDPWGGIYMYIRHQDYPILGAELPTTSPFYSSETYYNPTTFQIVSGGPNLATGTGTNFGKELDDVTNFFGTAY